jgi:chromate transporter
MIDGLALAETTPGPLIMVLQFVGFLAGFRNSAPLSPLAGGLLGSLVTVWVTFAPSFLFVLLGAPYMESLRRVRSLDAGLTAITAAVVGVILNLAVWFALQVLFREHTEVSLGLLRLELPRLASLDGRTLLVGLGAFLAIFRLRLGLLTVLGLAASAGLLLTFLRG